MPVFDRQPEFRGRQRDENKQPEESLSDTRMKDADLIFHHRDSKTAQNSLQNHTDNRNHAQVAKPSPVVAQPKPHGEDNREKSGQPILKWETKTCYSRTWSANRARPARRFCW